MLQRLGFPAVGPHRRFVSALAIDALGSGVPDALEELAQLGRTLWRRRDDILRDRCGGSSGEERHFWGEGDHPDSRLTRTARQAIRSTN